MKNITLFLAALIITFPSLTVAESIFEDDTIPPPLLPPEVDLYLQAMFGINKLADYNGEDTEMFEFNFGIEAHADTEANWHIAGEFGASSFGEDTITSQTEFASGGIDAEAPPGTSFQSIRTQNISEFQDAHLGLRLRKPSNSKLSYYGRIGLSFWQVENTVISTKIFREVVQGENEDNPESIPDTISNDDSGISAYIGLGGIYRLTNSWSTNVEFQYNKNDITPIYTGAFGLTYTF